MATVAVPSPIDWVDGQVYTATDYNTQIRDAIGFLLRTPMFYGQCTTTTALTTSAYTPIPMNVEIINTEGAGMHSTVTNPSRVTITHEGWWDFMVQGSWSPSANGNSGNRRITVRANGTTLLRGRKDFSGSLGATQQWVAAPIKATGYLFVGDYIELVQWHDAPAGTQSTWNNVDALPYIAASWRSKG